MFACVAPDENSIFFGCNQCKFCGPRFPRGWFVWYRWKRDCITCLPVWSQTNFGFFLVITHINFVDPVFQGVLCGIDENTTSRHVCLCGPRWTLESFGCNPFKFCGPCFPRGWFLWYRLKRDLISLLANLLFRKGRVDMGGEREWVVIGYL